MRKIFFTLTAILVLFILILSWSLDSATPVKAQSRVTPVRPSPGGGVPPDRPDLPFADGGIFQLPTVLPPAPESPTSVPPTIARAVPTNTPTATATPVPTATNTPLPGRVVVNEVLPRARNLDWNRDGAVNTDDQWIEIYNGGERTADLGGWKIDTGDKTHAFTIPANTGVAPNSWITFFRNETGIALDGVTQVRLLYPSGAVVDRVDYPVLGEDAVYARMQDGDGAWRIGCVQSPNDKNCQALGSAVANFNMPYFRENIASPTRPIDLAVLATNFLLAIILALAMGFFSNLLNDAIEAHEEYVAQLLKPVTQMIQRVRQAGSGFDEWLSKAKLAWLGFVFKLGLILLLYGLVLAYLDPSFAFITRDGLMLILALGLSTGLVALADDLATVLYLKQRGMTSSIRIHSGNIIIVVLSTLFSRVSGLVPGLILGSPAGIEDVPDDDAGARLDYLAIGATALVALVAWLLAPVFQNEAWLNTVLLLIFAAGVQTVFFEMLPVSYLRGKAIFQANRLAWFVISAIAIAVFLQTMLNPDGAFVSAFNSSNMIWLTIIVVSFCCISTLIWFYFQRLKTNAPA